VSDILFGATGGTTGGGTATAGGTGGALKLSAAGKGKGRHHPMDFFALAFRASNLFRGIQYQFFKSILASVTGIFVNRHLATPS